MDVMDSASISKLCYLLFKYRKFSYNYCPNNLVRNVVIFVSNSISRPDNLFCVLNFNFNVLVVRYSIYRLSDNLNISFNCLFGF